MRSDYDRVAVQVALACVCRLGNLFSLVPVYLPLDVFPLVHRDEQHQDLRIRQQVFAHSAGDF